MSDSLFFNRELSWLDFNARVLHEAEDARTPLLERLKFLGIVSTNLDEFYMVRVAGLRRQVAAGVQHAPPDGLPPQAQLDAIGTRVRALLERQARCFYDEVLPALAAHGVRLLRMDELTAAEWAHVDEIFEQQLFPVLTPLAVDPGHPFPYISNLSLSLAVLLRDPRSGAEHFARVKVPKRIVRWVPIGRPNCFVPVEQVIGANLGVLFPGMTIVGFYPFRITRYSDLEIPVEPPEDLLASIEEQVFQRRFGEVVRLEVQSDMPAHLRTLLVSEFRDEAEEPGTPPVTERDVHEVHGLLDLGDLIALSGLELPELRDTPFVPVTAPELRDGRSMFDVVRERDLLVHHPYESFASSVERLFQQAARDDAVLAIKLTLYRTSGDTAIVNALIEAAQRGKEVTVLVELKARFDEANNISWARTLEGFGIHVVYGQAHLKTHAKLALVVRRETDGIRRYVHIGTGNYNSRTARLYTDFGLFTADPSIGADVSDLFNSLTGFARHQLYRRLLVAPTELRHRIVALIDREAAHAAAGRPACILAKMNSLVDAEVIQALYRASTAGVEIDLVVRGVCCLRPGIPEVSDRIRVRSIIGRFLEHSRLWRFENAGHEEQYLGSADWMPRNFDRRVEAAVPVRDPLLKRRLGQVLAVCLADNRQAWSLAADGTWTQLDPGPYRVVAAQQELMRDPWGAATTIETRDPPERRASAEATAASGDAPDVPDADVADEGETREPAAVEQPGD